MSKQKLPSTNGTGVIFPRYHPN